MIVIIITNIHYVKLVEKIKKSAEKKYHVREPVNLQLSYFFVAVNNNLLTCFGFFLVIMFHSLFTMIVAFVDPVPLI